MGDFESKALQIFSFGDGWNDRMVGGLGVGFDFPEDAVGVIGCFKNYLLKGIGIDVMGTAEGGEDAVALQKL